MTAVRARPVPRDRPAGDVEVISVLGSFRRRPSAHDDPVHALIRRFRMGEAAAFAEVLGAGRAALDRNEALSGRRVAAVVVPGHDGTRHAALVRLVAMLADATDWTVAEPGQLVRHTHVAEAKHHPSRDRVAELASLRAAPGTLPEGIETVLLVDDVMASGATIRACVGALRRDAWRGRVAAMVLACAA